MKFEQLSALPRFNIKTDENPLKSHAAAILEQTKLLDTADLRKPCFLQVGCQKLPSEPYLVIIIRVDLSAKRESHHVKTLFDGECWLEKKAANCFKIRHADTENTAGNYCQQQ